MKNIPFKPLSERMLEEPFWLGLITVIAVLLLIAFAYFLKKHLSESFEKLFVDDLEKGKVVERSCSGYYQCTPQVSIASDANDITALIASTGGTMERERRSSSFDISPSAAARSLLSKLSIRKPSILSISSNASSPGGIGGNGNGGGGGGSEQKFSSSQEDLILRRKSTDP